MNVNELARRAGVKPHVVRYYTRIGLLRPVRDPGNGYRRFGNRDLARLRFTRLARGLGCSLGDIKALLKSLDGGGDTWPELLHSLERRLAEICQEQRRLQCLEARLTRVLQGAANGVMGEESLEAMCRWIETMTQEDEPEPLPGIALTG